MLDSYDRTLGTALLRPAGHRRRTGRRLRAQPLACIRLLGVAYFPRTDPGQFVINVKAPSGTRIEITEN